jgi:hypothetical protein
MRCHGPLPGSEAPGRPGLFVQGRGRARAASRTAAAGILLAPPTTVVRRTREHALELLREQIAVAFRDDPRSPVTELLARFALAAIDGAD